MRSTIAHERTPRRRVLLLAAAATLLLAMLVPGPATARGASERADVLTQDESDVLVRNGARLWRTDHSFRVAWKIPTPEPGTYLYPTPDQIPPGAPPHPPIEPGHPEVFTLWAFVFNFPDECSDACDFDDIGDTPAQGGIYQLDGTVARSHKLRMGGKVRLGQPPAAGAALQNPTGADVHVALTSHGKAREGADLARQLNGAVGGPPNWWVAIFE